MPSTWPSSITKKISPPGLDDRGNGVAKDLAIGLLDHEVLFDPGPVEPLELLAILLAIGDDRGHRA